MTAATNGDQFFVAWQDPDDLVASDWNVRFRTYDALGVPEQTFPLTAPGFATPTVVWTGGGWFVASSGPSYSQPADAISGPPPLYGGVVREPGNDAGHRINFVSSDPLPGGSVAWNGSVLMLSNGDKGFIAGAEGSVIREFPSYWLPLASVGGKFLVQSIWGNLWIVDDAGQIVRGSIAVTGRLLGATVHGDEYAVLTATDGPAPSTTLVILDAGGNVKSTTTTPASPDMAGYVTDGAVVWSGGSYAAGVVRFGSSSTVTSTLCLFRPAVSGASQCRSGYVFGGLALAANDRTLLVAWSEKRLFASDRVSTVYSRDRVSTSTSSAGSLPDLSAPVEAAMHLQEQIYPSIFRDPDGFTVSWTEPGDVGRAVAGGLDANLTPRAPRVISDAGAVRTRLARGSVSTMACWLSPDNNVYAQELRDDGAASPPILLGSSGYDASYYEPPAVAFDGQDWLVVWAGLDFQVMAALVRPSASVAPVARPVAPSAFRQSGVVVASRGRDFLVVWEESPVSGAIPIGAFVDRDGLPAGPALTLLAPPDRYFGSLDVTAAGQQYLVAVAQNTTRSAITVTRKTPDVLVCATEFWRAPVAPRVHGRTDGGFGVLWGSRNELRFVSLDALGGVTRDFTVPRFISDDYPYTDFIENDGRLMVVYGTPGRRPQLLLETFAPHRRAVGMR